MFRLSMAFYLALAAPALSAALQVSPVHLEVAAPGAATTLALRNVTARPMSAQMRVMLWTQSNGEERLEPTRDVVASPPFVTLKPQQDYTVRIVRVAKQPVAGEESYRLVIDEVPEAPPRGGTINLVMRLVVPVFFSSADASTNPAWTASRHGNTLRLTAANQGERRLRLTDIRIRDAGGRQIGARSGLVGYVLGRSAMTWPIDLAPGATARGPLRLSGTTDGGPFEANLVVQAGP
jgi:fimbrial chaperone protein